MGFFQAGDRRRVAVVITTDGRRVALPLDDRPVGLSLLSVLRTLELRLEGLLQLLIAGFRREGRGTRQDG